MAEKHPSYHEDTLSQASRSARTHSSASSQERRIGDSSSTSRRGSRRISRVSETVTVHSNCEQVPDTCALCGQGIPFSKCNCCDNQAHNRCIEAFFCTTDQKVDVENWKCPKCVTITHLGTEADDSKSQEQSTANSYAEEVEIGVKETKPTNRKPPNPDCIFCKIDMEVKNCRCQACVDCLKDSINQKCTCGESGKPQSLRYNRCLQYRDFSSNIYYQNLDSVNEGETCSSHTYDTEAENEDDESDFGSRVCWSICWFLLLVTFAFPIAFICAPIFIILFCFESCCRGCHPVCCFFLEGLKLPGTCCRGICTGRPMCTSNDNFD